MENWVRGRMAKLSSTYWTSPYEDFEKTRMGDATHRLTLKKKKLDQCDHWVSDERNDFYFFKEMIYIDVEQIKKNKLTDGNSGENNIVDYDFDRVNGDEFRILLRRFHLRPSDNKLFVTMPIMMGLEGIVMVEFDVKDSRLVSYLFDVMVDSGKVPTFVCETPYGPDLKYMDCFRELYLFLYIPEHLSDVAKKYIQIKPI